MESLSVVDVMYDEPVLRSPHSLADWLSYLQHKSNDNNNNINKLQIQAAAKQREIIYERALKALPKSYKLWMKYLNEKLDLLVGVSPLSSLYVSLNVLFERALSELPHLPLLWRKYLLHINKQTGITHIRHTFDRALRCVPLTQHSTWLWPVYLEWANQSHVPVESAARIYTRYLKIHPQHVEDYILFLKKAGRIEEAASQLATLLNDPHFVSQHGKSKYDLWSSLLKLLTAHPHTFLHSKAINVDAVIRSGIHTFAHEVGRLWVHLASYYASVGLFDCARDVFEEAVQCVSSVRDFTLVFDAYTKFEEAAIQAKMKLLEEKQQDEHSFLPPSSLLPFIPSSTCVSYLSLIHSGSLYVDDADVDLSMLRLDDLMQRRPLLLSSVLLRQNPHSVSEWQKRVALFPDDPLQQIQIYTEAVTTIDPHQANNGKIEKLWSNFARFYEKHDDLPNARLIYEKGTCVNFKSVDSLCSVWCDWVEMELKHGQYDHAMQVIAKACTLPKGIKMQQINDNTQTQHTLTAQQKLYKSTKLWSLYADMCENFGTLESTKQVYEQMFYLKIVTPSIVLSYASLMWSHSYYEETFRIFEKGVSLFDFPHVYPIWMCYLKHFMERYKGTKIERTRELFEQAIEQIPHKESKKLFLLYGKFEEEHGLVRRAMNIYQRACENAQPSDRYELYIVYLARCSYRFGVAKTREIYERAIAHLPDVHVRAMCVKYAGMERSMGEIDRARAIYTYGAQFADPRTQIQYWKVWSEFEVAHGNQETYKDMLRIKRTVLGNFASISIVPQQSAAPLLTTNSIFKPSTITKPSPSASPASTHSPHSQSASLNSDSISLLKRRRDDDVIANASSTKQLKSDHSSHPSAAHVEPSHINNADQHDNPEEINLEDIEQVEEEEEEADIGIQHVPDAVFGLGK